MKTQNSHLAAAPADAGSVLSRLRSRGMRLLALATGAVVLATAWAAQNPAAASERAVGTLFGAGVGAIAGQQFGGTEGAVVGGVVGAVVGSQLAHNDRRGYDRPYRAEYPVIFGPPIWSDGRRQVRREYRHDRRQRAARRSYRNGYADGYRDGRIDSRRHQRRWRNRD